MSTTSKNHRKRFIGPIVCLVVYWLNLVLILVYQGLFVHTIPASEYGDKYAGPDLRDVAFFADCEILDMESCDPECYILYKTPAGDVKIAELERNFYFNRYTIKKNRTQTVPAGSGTQILENPNLLGTDEITIVDQTDIVSVASSGLIRQQTVIQGIHMGIAIVLLLVEIGIYNLLKKKASAR